MCSFLETATETLWDLFESHAVKYQGWLENQGQVFFLFFGL